MLGDLKRGGRISSEAPTARLSTRAKLLPANRSDKGLGHFLISRTKLNSNVAAISGDRCKISCNTFYCERCMSYGL
jgi:hypothetical protein